MTADRAGDPAMLCLSVFLRASDRRGGRPLHDEIIGQARAAGLGGATAFRGLQGFGATGSLHSAGVARLGDGVPVRIDIIAPAARIRAFLPVLDQLVGSGIAVVSPVAARWHAAADMSDKAAAANLAAARPPHVS